MANTATARAPLALPDESRPPLNEALAQHVIEGLSAPQKALSSAWFYDDEGTRLFQQIMAMPEYYLTGAEYEILHGRGDELASWIAPSGRDVDLIELGSGDGEKTLSLCEALERQGGNCTFYPMDVSELALSLLSRRFQKQLPSMRVQPLCADYFLNWPATSENHRQVVMLLGSNLGNQNHAQSIALLRRIRAQLQPGDALVLGLDLMKDPRRILAAYNDGQGVTSRFNLNLLARLNRELDMDFALDRFSHYATYSPLDGAARSFLVSQNRQVVRSRRLARDFAFQAGETIYTEQSQKYSRNMIEKLARHSDFDVQCYFTDKRGLCTVVVWCAVEPAHD